MVFALKVHTVIFDHTKISRTFESAYYFNYEHVHIVDIEQIKDSAGYQFY